MGEAGSTRGGAGNEAGNHYAADTRSQWIGDGLPGPLPERDDKVRKHAR